MNENIKSVGDMYLAAALLAYGAKLKSVDRGDVKRQKFIFINSNVPSIVISNNDTELTHLKLPSLDDIETYFIARRLWLPPSYPDSVRNIKSAIHSYGN